LYDPIPQGAVILQKAADKPAVKAFMEFMRSPAAIEVIKEYGYLVQ
jgi:molybdate transport system substrate-binding protein